MRDFVWWQSRRVSITVMCKILHSHLRDAVAAQMASSRDTSRCGAIWGFRALTGLLRASDRTDTVRGRHESDVSEGAATAREREFLGCGSRSLTLAVLFGALREHGATRPNLERGSG
jgi:hypothetical protein